MRADKTGKDPEVPLARRSSPAAAEGDAPAWEMIEAGRYMPRRIRGSFRGRELG
jgi:hypothetical protein